MDESTPLAQRPASLSSLSQWEQWIDTLFAWVPYATLAVSVVLAQVVADDALDRLATIGLAVVAAVWTWATFTRNGQSSKMPQRQIRIYFVGFVILAAALMLRETVFLVYGLTGFLHAYLLRPWALTFAGIGAAGFVVHSHIVITESTTATWAIYIGVVSLQTVAVSAGLYGGLKISETAETRRRDLEQLELTIKENDGLHEQLVTQAREAGVLDERQRMAREIHDTIAQGLTGVITQIEAVHQSWDDEIEVRRRLETAVDLARHSLAEARRSVQALRPGELVESQLPSALAKTALQWSEANELPVQTVTTGDSRPLHPEIEVTLLRSAQESLANVAKHAAASRAGVTLTFMDDSVALDIRDDGTGFDPHAARQPGHYGLAAMRQRVENMNGSLHVESALGEGTAISVRIPTAPSRSSS